MRSTFLSLVEQFAVQRNSPPESPCLSAESLQIFFKHVDEEEEYYRNNYIHVDDDDFNEDGFNEDDFNEDSAEIISIKRQDDDEEILMKSFDLEREIKSLMSGSIFHYKISTIALEAIPSSSCSTLFSFLIHSKTQLKHIFLSFNPITALTDYSNQISNTLTQDDTSDYSSLDVFLKSCNSLETLDTHRCCFSSLQIKTLIPALIHSPSLKVLKLEGDFISDDGAVALAHILPSLLNLDILHLTPLGYQTPYSQITDYGGIRLLDNLYRSKILLRHLHLPGNLFTDTFFFPLSRYLKLNKKLEILDLSSNVGFDGDGFKYMIEPLKIHPSLRDLKLELSSSENINALSQIIPTNRSIQRLFLNSLFSIPSRRDLETLISSVHQNCIIRYFECWCHPQNQLEINSFSHDFYFKQVYDRFDRRVFRSGLRTPFLLSELKLNQIAEQALRISRLLRTVGWKIPIEIQYHILELFFKSEKVPFILQDRREIQNVLIGSDSSIRESSFCLCHDKLFSWRLLVLVCHVLYTKK